MGTPAEPRRRNTAFKIQLASERAADADRLDEEGVLTRVPLDPEEDVGTKQLRQWLDIERFGFVALAGDRSPRMLSKVRLLQRSGEAFTFSRSWRLGRERRSRGPFDACINAKVSFQSLVHEGAWVSTLRA